MRTDALQLTKYPLAAPVLTPSLPPLPAVVTVLKVDQIIMAKQAGGPKPRGGGDDDE